MKENETIAAIASAVGIGAIAVVRVSGDKSFEVCDRVLKRPISRQSPNRILLNEIIAVGEVVDIVMVVFFKAPNSYTGEDMIEIYCHGGQYVPNRILDLLLENGARSASPGEFTMRAVLNDKLDLIQAEAILDIVEARTGEVARVAIRNLQGGFSKTVSEFSRQITDLLVQVEGNLDFPENEEWMGIDKIKAKIVTVDKGLNKVIEQGRDGVMIREGPIVVLSGRKNVGKSTLFNKLLGFERAIVTPIPGTTRDYLMEDLKIGQHFVRLVDTAGIGHAGGIVEADGIKRAKDFIDNGDLVILVLDRSEPIQEDDQIHLKLTQDRNRVVVLNKSDLKKKLNSEGDIEVSAKNGEGIGLLKELLVKRIFKTKARNNLILRKRQLDAIINAKKFVESALNQDYLETISSDLRRGLGCLGELTGKVTNEDILNRIFSQFCIGK